VGHPRSRRRRRLLSLAPAPSSGSSSIRHNCAEKERGKRQPPVCVRRRCLRKKPARHASLLATVTRVFWGGGDPTWPGPPGSARHTQSPKGKVFCVGGGTTWPGPPRVSLGRSALTGLPTDFSRTNFHFCLVETRPPPPAEWGGGRDRYLGAVRVSPKHFWLAIGLGHNARDSTRFGTRNALSQITDPDLKRFRRPEPEKNAIETEQKAARVVAT
jgi:hypothetical protein